MQWPWSMVPSNMFLPYFLSSSGFFLLAVTGKYVRAKEEPTQSRQLLTDARCEFRWAVSSCDVWLLLHLSSLFVIMTMLGGRGGGYGGGPYYQTAHCYHQNDWVTVWGIYFTALVMGGGGGRQTDKQRHRQTAGGGWGGGEQGHKAMSVNHNVWWERWLGSDLNLGPSSYQLSEWLNTTTPNPSAVWATWSVLSAISRTQQSGVNPRRPVWRGRAVS